MSFARRMQTKVPLCREYSLPSPSLQIVLIRVVMLCVLQLTIWTKRSSPGTRVSSLTPRAYGLPKPNSLPWARKPLGPVRPS